MLYFSVIKEQTHCYHDLTGSLSRMTCPRPNLVAVISPVDEGSVPVSSVPLSKWEKTTDTGVFSQGKTCQDVTVSSICPDHRAYCSLISHSKD